MTLVQRGADFDFNKYDFSFEDRKEEFFFFYLSNESRYIHTYRYEIDGELVGMEYGR